MDPHQTRTPLKASRSHLTALLLESQFQSSLFTRMELVRGYIGNFKIKWNFLEMKPQKGGGNYVIDGTKLTIYDVKKGQFGSGDNAVYQCKAENKHGYVWTNFYLNLLGREFL